MRVFGCIFPPPCRHVGPKRLQNATRNPKAELVGYLEGQRGAKRHQKRSINELMVAKREPRGGKKIPKGTQRGMKTERKGAKWIQN